MIALDMDRVKPYIRIQEYITFERDGKRVRCLGWSDEKEVRKLTIINLN